MGNNRGKRSRCNGEAARRCISAAWACLVLILVLTNDLHAARTFTITASAGSNGTISPSGSVKVNSGSSQAFTIAPNTGYHVEDVKVDGVSQGAITTYTFSNVTANHTISATFAINTYTITATAWSGGSITPTSATVNYGGSQTFTITPNSGYHVTDVAVDGVSQGAITSFTFTNITASHTISATFASGTYTITTSAGSGGAVVPSAATVNSGGSQTFTITPNTGYSIAFVLVDGVSQGAITSYTFTNVAAPHAISAVFTSNTSSPPATTANYFYDDLGRLTRAVTDTAGAVYQYDELGNLVSVITSTTTSGSPMISGINPNILFMGSTLQVVITGQNLLATETVTSTNGLIGISNVTISDTQITADMTPLAIGMDTIRVTSRNGTPNTADVTIPVSTLVLSPGQLALTPGTSGTITAVISPPPPTSMTFSLNNSNPSIATIPQYLTIPASGSTNIAVDTLQLGIATIDAGGVRSVVFVSNPFSGDVNGLTAAAVSVHIDAPAGTSPVNANSVSVRVDAPYGSAPETAAPVSVGIDAPMGSSLAVSSGVSVKFQ